MIGQGGGTDRIGSAASLFCHAARQCYVDRATPLELADIPEPRSQQRRKSFPYSFAMAGRFLEDFNPLQEGNHRPGMRSRRGRTWRSLTAISVEAVSAMMRRKPLLK